jgi:hypothetical protein
MATPPHRHDHRHRPRQAAGRARCPWRPGMNATLRWRLLTVPARLIRHARWLPCAYGPATTCSPRSSPASAPCLNRLEQAEQPPTERPTRSPEATLGPLGCPTASPCPDQHQFHPLKISSRPTDGFRSERRPEQPNDPGCQ